MYSCVSYIQYLFQAAPFLGCVSQLFWAVSAIFSNRFESCFSLFPFSLSAMFLGFVEPCFRILFQAESAYLYDTTRLLVSIITFAFRLSRHNFFSQLCITMYNHVLWRRPSWFTSHIILLHGKGGPCWEEGWVRACLLSLRKVHLFNKVQCNKHKLYLTNSSFAKDFDLCAPFMVKYFFRKTGGRIRIESMGAEKVLF
jgi:hypothetical protein